MKNYITSLLFIGTIFTSGAAMADNVVLSKAEDLVFKDEGGIEVVYDKDGNLYSGAVVIPDEQQREITYFYSQGKKSGVAYSRFGSGKMELEITYANGRKNGEEILFYPSNTPQYKKTYKNDVLNGEEVLFYENGTPSKRSYYTDGKLDGEVYYFNTNGDHTKIETYKNGIKDGLERIIEDNVLREENNYVDGKLHGTTKKYGLQYLTDEIEYQNGMRNGMHTTYREDGSKIQVPYKNDKKEGEGKVFYDDGELAQIVNYTNDARNGSYRKYSPKGQLITEENYKNNLKEGISRQFDEKDRLTVVSYFMEGVELAKIEINKREDLKNIQDAFFNKQLDKYSNKRNLWYKILWLALNTDQPEILQLLEKEMKMYAVDVNDMRIYQRYSGSQFEHETKQLFFGLTPLDYAVNLDADTEVLQKFINQLEDTNSRGLTPLRDAIRLNKADMVKYLLLNNAEVHNTDKNGNTILQYAIANQASDDIVANIIKAGVDINAYNNQDQSALMMAISYKNSGVVKMLLEAKADTRKLSNGESLLFYAYNKKAPLEIIQLLVESGVDVNSTDDDGNNLLLKALKDGNDEMALFVLEKGGDVNFKDGSGESAVAYVLFNETSPQVIEEIFKKDYDVKAKVGNSNKMLWKVLMEQNRLDLLQTVWDKMTDVAVSADENGEIPVKSALEIKDNPQLRLLALSYVQQADAQMIWDALNSKDLSLFKQIMAKQADVNTANERQESLLIYMVKNGYGPDFMDVIQTKELNLDAEDENKLTALDYALQAGDLETAEYLLKAGANPNHVINGGTALTNATAAQKEMVQLLLKYNADANMEIEGSEPALMLAVKNLNLTLFEHLAAQENSDFSIKDDNGNTLLLASADYFAKAAENDDKQLLSANFLAIAKLLLEKGLDINLQNGNGETLLVKLAKYADDNYEEMAEFLLENGAQPDIKDQYGKKAEDYRLERQ